MSSGEAASGEVGKMKKPWNRRLWRTYRIIKRAMDIRQAELWLKQHGNI